MTRSHNLIIDVAGVRIGHAQDDRIASGVTVVMFDAPAVASVDVRGGGPGTREVALLDPAMTVERIDAIALSGGSAFGLDAASGVQALLREQGRGFAVGPAQVPIVPGAILFDLLNGGDKNWGRYPPYRELAYAAATSASTDCALGSVGAGLGATTVNLKGGVGSASTRVASVTVAALAVVNAAGSVTVSDGAHFWAAPFEETREFGGRGPALLPAPGATAARTKGAPGMSTTLAVVVTDATLSKVQAKRLAVMAQDGVARAIYPVHTPLDGDIMFAAATGVHALHDPGDLTRLGTAAANVTARAIARAIYEATALPFGGALPAYRDLFRSKA